MTKRKPRARTPKKANVKIRQQVREPIDILQGPSYSPDGMTTEIAPSTTFRGQVDAEAVNALSIGQVAQNYGVSIDQLRNWDDLGILSPSRVGSQRVYFMADLRRLEMIRRWMAEGYRPKEIRMGLELQHVSIGRRSTSGTKALQEAAGAASVGEWIREPLPDKRAYNSAYRRLERALKGARRKHTPIRTAEDGKSLEARIIE